MDARLIPTRTARKNKGPVDAAGKCITILIEL